MKITIGKKKKNKVCEKCGGEVEYIKQYNRWYCRKCELYTAEDNVETKVLKPTTEYEGKKEGLPPPPTAEDPKEYELISQQKNADMDYYNKLYANVDISKEETAKLLYGVLAETKTLNFQLAQLIEMIRQGLLIKK